jgi:polyisoprenoid-binding protein YceI
MRKTFFSLLLAAHLAAPASALADNYTIDPTHTDIGFRVRHMMVSFTKGHFKKFEGTVVLDDKAPAKSQIDVSIDTASVNSELEDRDKHLRSADFLDSEKFPKMTFKSKKVKVISDSNWQVTGDLTIRGVTKEVVLNVKDIGKDTKDPWGNIRRGATASTKISRKDFGLLWNKALEAGGVAVADEVLIELDIELIKKT